MILTVEISDGQLSCVDAESDTYETALAAANAQVSEGSRTVVIRTP